MEKEFEDKYVILNNKIRLLKFPTYGVLKESNKEKEAIAFLNRDAVMVLELCNGKRRIRDIIQLLAKNPEESYKLKNFLISATKKNHIVLYSYPVENIQLDIRGTMEFYMPLHITIELTDACNLHCVHCYRLKKNSKDRNFINSEKLLPLIKEFSRETTVVVEFTGGEPLLHPDFSKIVNIAAHNFEIIGILTNGTYLPERILEEIMHLKNKFFWGISLDSHMPSYHDRFRGKKGAWQATVENIRKLIRKGFRVRVAMSITPQNISHISKVAELCISLGVEMFTYSPVLPFGRADLMFWDPSDLQRLHNEDQKVREKYQRIIPIVQIEKFGEEGVMKNCGAGWKTLTIDPEFRVRPCVMADISEDIIGKIKEEDIYDLYVFFRKVKEKTNFYANLNPPTKNICGNCKFLNFCSPCMLRAKLVNKKNLIKKEHCKWFFRSYLNNNLYIC